MVVPAGRDRGLGLLWAGRAAALEQPREAGPAAQLCSSQVAGAQVGPSVVFPPPGCLPVSVPPALVVLAAGLPGGVESAGQRGLAPLGRDRNGSCEEEKPLLAGAGRGASVTRVGIAVSLLGRCLTKV